MLKRVLVVAGALVLLLAAALAALPWFLNTKAFQAYLAQAAAHALGRPVKFAELSIATFPLPAVKLRDLEVADDPAFSTRPFLTVREGRIGIRIRPLLSGRIELADMTLEEPTITVVEDASGRWNWASLGTPGPGHAAPPKSGGRVGGAAVGAVLLSQIKVVDGRMQHAKLGKKGSSDVQLEKVNLTISQTAPGAGVRLRGSALAQPGGVNLVIRDASLTPTSSRALGEMALRATVDVAMRDVAPLLAVFGMPPSGAGTLDGRFEVVGTPVHFAATGAARSDRLILTGERPQCEPRRRQLVMSDLRIPIVYTEARVESVPLQAKVANGTVTLRLSLDLGLDLYATLEDIRVAGVEMGPVLVDFLCQPGAVTGPMDLEGEANLRVRDPWRTAMGSGRLKIGPGKVVGRDILKLVNDVAAMADATSDVSNPERRDRRAAPLDFTSITATYTITDGVVKTADLLYQSPDLRVLGAGTFRLADQQVDMTLTFTQGRNEMKGTVSGTPGSLRVVPGDVRVQDSRSIKKFLEKLFR